MRSRCLRTSAAIFVAAAVLYLGAPPLTKYLIARNFTEVSLEERTAAYLQRSAETLSRIDAVSVGVSVRHDTLRHAFDTNIDNWLARLLAGPVEGVGTITLVDHTLTMGLQDMAIDVQGDVHLVLPQYDASVTAHLNIHILPYLDGAELVYIPTLANLRLLSLETRALAWWPFDLAAAANRALALCLDAINGAIDEQRHRLPTPRLPGKPTRVHIQRDGQRSETTPAVVGRIRDPDRRPRGRGNR